MLIPSGPTADFLLLFFKAVVHSSKVMGRYCIGSGFGSTLSAKLVIGSRLSSGVSRCQSHLVCHSLANRGIAGHLCTFLGVVHDLLGCLGHLQPKFYHFLGGPHREGLGGQKLVDLVPTNILDEYDLLIPLGPLL